MPGRCLFALAALGSVTVAVAVAGVTRAGGSVSRGASGAVTSAWPLSAGPVTSLPGPLVAMTPGDVTNGGEATLLALGTRAIWEVAIGASGMGAVTGTTPLAPGADPVAIACGSRPLDLSDANSPLPCRGSLVFVLDRASEAVLVFEPEPDGSLAQKASLAVGSRPSAFVLADFNDDANDDDIAVANEGSDDVSVVLGRDDGSYAPQQRVPVGARPRDIVAGEYNPESGSDLAVADSGAGSISFLLGDNHGAFARHDVAVGGSPTALLADSSDDDSLDLDGKGLPDLVVADATAGTVGVLLARRGALPRLASRVSLPGGAASEPVALRQIDGLGGEGNHLLVATHGTGEVLNIPVSDTGALGAASSVLSGAQPVALDVRYALTADVGEDAVVADGSGALRSLLRAGSSSSGGAPRTSPPAAAWSCGLSAWERGIACVSPIAPAFATCRSPRRAGGSHRGWGAPPTGRRSSPTCAAARTTARRGCGASPRAAPAGCRFPPRAAAARRTSRSGMECSRSSATPARPAVVGAASAGCGSAHALTASGSAAALPGSATCAGTV
jgi:hypothetical protein